MCRKIFRVRLVLLANSKTLMEQHSLNAKTVRRSSVCILAPVQSLVISYAILPHFARLYPHAFLNAEFAIVLEQEIIQGISASQHRRKLAKLMRIGCFVAAICRKEASNCSSCTTRTTANLRLSSCVPTPQQALSIAQVLNGASDSSTNSSAISKEKAAKERSEIIVAIADTETVSTSTVEDIEETMEAINQLTIKADEVNVASQNASIVYVSTVIQSVNQTIRNDTLIKGGSIVSNIVESLQIRERDGDEGAQDAEPLDNEERDRRSAVLGTIAETAVQLSLAQLDVEADGEIASKMGPRKIATKSMEFLADRKTSKSFMNSSYAVEGATVSMPKSLHGILPAENFEGDGGSQETESQLDIVIVRWGLNPHSFSSDEEISSIVLTMEIFFERKAIARGKYGRTIPDGTRSKDQSRCRFGRERWPASLKGYQWRARVICGH